MPLRQGSIRARSCWTYDPMNLWTSCACVFCSVPCETESVGKWWLDWVVSKLAWWRSGLGTGDPPTTLRMTHVFEIHAVQAIHTEKCRLKWSQCCISSVRWWVLWKSSQFILSGCHASKRSLLCECAHAYDTRDEALELEIEFTVHVFARITDGCVTRTVTCSYCQILLKSSSSRQGGWKEISSIIHISWFL